MCDDVGKEFLVTEEQLLFPRKFDRSRWQVRLSIDCALDTIEGDVLGWGGNDGQLIARQGIYYRPVAFWREVLQFSTSTIFTQLQQQCEADLPRA